MDQYWTFWQALLTGILVTALGVPMGDVVKEVLWKLIAVVEKWLGAPLNRAPDAHAIINATTHVGAIVMTSQDNTDPSTESNSPMPLENDTILRRLVAATPCGRGSSVAIPNIAVRAAR